MIYTGKIKHHDQIYDGLHQAIISETIFNLAQEIHTNRPKKHKVYKDHVFGGMVYCKNCGYKMTPCFTNKKVNGKLKRYFYYRCINTIKRDWNSYEVKQVNADKLENFIVETLERILRDDLYLKIGFSSK